MSVACLYKRFSKKEAFPSLLKLGRAADTLDMMMRVDICAERSGDYHKNADTLDPK